MQIVRADAALMSTAARSLAATFVQMLAPQAQDPVRLFHGKGRLAAFLASPIPAAPLRIVLRLTAARTFQAKDLLCQALPLDEEGTVLDVEASWGFSASLGSRYAYLPELSGTLLVELPPFSCTPPGHRVLFGIRQWRGAEVVAGDVTIEGCFTIQQLAGGGPQCLVYQPVPRLELT